MGFGLPIYCPCGTKVKEKGKSEDLEKGRCEWTWDYQYVVTSGQRWWGGLWVTDIFSLAGQWNIINDVPTEQRQS